VEDHLMATQLGTYQTAGATSHTINFTASAAGSDVLVFAISGAAMTFPAGWTLDATKLQADHSGIWRYPGALNTTGISSVTFTTSAERSAAAVVVQDYVYPAPYDGWSRSGNSPVGGGTLWGSGLHNYVADPGGESSYAVFASTCVSGGGWSGTGSSVDQGFTILGQEQSDAASYEGCTMIVTHADDTAMSGGGVTLTFDPVETQTRNTNSTTPGMVSYTARDPGTTVPVVDNMIFNLSMENNLDRRTAGSDAAAYSLLTRFTTDTAGWSDTIWWYKWDGLATSSITFFIVDLDGGTILGQASTTFNQEIGWKKVTLGSPVVLSTGTQYGVGMSIDAATNFTSVDFVAGGVSPFSGGPVTSGPLTAQGRSVGTGPSPATTGYTDDTTTYYFVDLEFNTGGVTALMTDVGAISNTASTAVTDTVTISASDDSGAVVSASVDVGSQSWLSVSPASGAEPQAFIVTSDPTGLADGQYNGTVTFSAAGYDDLVVPVALTAASSQSIWYPDAVPNSVTGDPTNYAFVTEFSVAVDGTADTVHIYKGESADWPAMTVYIGEKGGAVLETGTLDAGTGTGWVSGSLDSPVSLSPGNNYVVGIVIPSTVDYAAQSGISWPVVSGDITATQAGFYASATAPQTGTYATFNNSTYYVDLSFTPDGGADTTGPVVQSRTPVVDATNVAVGQTVSATFDENLGGTPTMSLSPSVAGSQNVSGATISFDPTADLANDTTYTVTVTGIEDATGNTSSDVSWSFTTAAAPATNPIVTENALAGSPDAGYALTGAGNGEVGALGYTKQFSYNTGEGVEFCIDCQTTGADRNLSIFRLGGYDFTVGNQQYKRLVETITYTVQDQSGTTPTTVATNSLAMNWATSATWDSTGAVSGMYVAAVKNAADEVSAWIPFVIRDDNRDADIVVKVSDSTWGAAYNYFGDIGTEKTGRNLYGIGDVGNIADRVYKVSYDRPIVTRTTVINHWDIYELPLINYLESNGYNVKYIGCYDLETQDTNDVLGNAKVLISAGHDEYWSQGMRDNAEAFRDAGGNLLFLSANHVFWRVRWEDAGRTMVCYKDTMEASQIDPVSWTGTWRDPDWPSNDPESTITGDFFRMNNRAALTMTLAPGAYQSNPFWRDTAVAAGSGLSVADLIGFEAQEHDLPVADGVLLADTTANIDGSYASDDGGSYSGNGDLAWGIAMFRAAPGSGVTVSVGTMNWLWALSDARRGGSVAANTAIQQATANLLYDMGAVGDTFDTNLVEPTPVSFEAYGLAVQQRSGLGLGEGGTWEPIVPPGGAWLYSTVDDSDPPSNNYLQDGDLQARISGGELSWKARNGDVWTDVDAGASRMRWVGEHVVDGTAYETNDVVRDEGWTMVANKATTDRPAPTPLGDPFYVYDSDTMAEDTSTASAIIVGQEYTFPVTAYATGYRLWTKASQEYSVYLIVGGVTRELLSNYIPQADMVQEIAVPSTLVQAGTSFRLLAQIKAAQPVSSTFSGSWNYQTPNNTRDPAAGEIVHSFKEPDQFRVSKTDADTADRSADLATLSIGDHIYGAGGDWTVQAIVDQGTWIQFFVLPYQNGSPEGSASFTFEVITAQLLTAGHNDNYWSTTPYSGSVVGLFTQTGYSNIATNDHAWGIDLEVQYADISADWDVLATPEGSITTGGESVRTISVLGDLADVDTTTPPTDQQALVWDDGAQTWVPGSVLDQTTADNLYLNASGDTMSGRFVADELQANHPTRNDGFIIQPWVDDSAVGAIIPVDNNVNQPPLMFFGGQWAFGTPVVVGEPVADTDATTKGYVDSSLSAISFTTEDLIYAPAEDQPTVATVSQSTFAGPTITSDGWYREKREGSAESAVQATPSGSATGDLDMTGSTYFRYTGFPSAYGHPANAGHFVVTDYMPGSSGTVQASKWKFGVEFVTSSPEVQFRMRAGATNATFGQLYVNGRPVQEDPFVCSTAAGSAYHATLTFPDARPRTIKLVTAGAGGEGGFGGVAVETGYTVSKPINPVGRSVAFIGDSYVAGAAGVTVPRSWMYPVARWLGADEIIFAGIGSTGWAGETSLGATSRFEGRYAIVQAMQPDIVVFAGGRNDSPGIQSLVEAGIDAFSDAQVILVPTASNGVQATVTSEIEAAAAASPGAVFAGLDVDAYEKADGTHLTEAAHDEFAAGVILALKKSLEVYPSDSAATTGATTLVVSDLSEIPPGTPAGTVIVLSEGAPTNEPYVASSSSIYEGTSFEVVLPAPSDVQDGDLILAFIANQTPNEVEAGNGGEMTTIPAGFSRVAWAPYGADSGIRWQAVYAKTASSESGDYTFAWDTTYGRALGGLLVIRNATSVIAYNGPDTETDNVPLLPTVAVSQDCLAIGFAHTVHTATNDGRCTFAGWDAQVSIIAPDYLTASGDSLTLVSRSYLNGETAGGEVATLGAGTMAADAAATLLIA
jgi:hypothetical protein